MADDSRHRTGPLPVSVARSEVVIAGVVLIIHQLDNGERIVERDSMLELFDAMHGGSLTAADAQALAQALGSPARGRRR